MNEKVQHTPGPWKIDNDGYMRQITDDDGMNCANARAAIAKAKGEK